MRILSIVTIAPTAASEPPTQKEMESMGSFIAEMRSSGVLIDTGGRMPNMLELTVARKNGNTTITDRAVHRSEGSRRRFRAAGSERPRRSDRRDESVSRSHRERNVSPSRSGVFALTARDEFRPVFWRIP